MREIKVQTIKHIGSGLFVRSICFLLIACPGLFPCCHTPPPENQIREIDSLISLTIDLQNKISSPEMQMLSDFSYEIENDLTFLNDSNQGVSQPSFIVEEIEQYTHLRKDIEECLTACKNYGEEVFMIENNLRDIRTRLLRNNNYEELGELIETEKDLLNDLLSRIQSNIGFIDKHMKDYWHLKPLIDSLKLDLITE